MWISYLLESGRIQHSCQIGLWVLLTGFHNLLCRFKKLGESLVFPLELLVGVVQCVDAPRHGVEILPFTLTLAFGRKPVGPAFALALIDTFAEKFLAIFVGELGSSSHDGVHKRSDKANGDFRRLAFRLKVLFLLLSHAGHAFALTWVCLGFFQMDLGSGGFLFSRAATVVFTSARPAVAFIATTSLAARVGTADKVPEGRRLLLGIPSSS